MNSTFSDLACVLRQHIPDLRANAGKDWAVADPAGKIAAAIEEELPGRLSYWAANTDGQVAIRAEHVEEFMFSIYDHWKAKTGYQGAQ